MTVIAMDATAVEGASAGEMLTADRPASEGGAVMNAPGGETSAARQASTAVKTAAADKRAAAMTAAATAAAC